MTTTRQFHTWTPDTASVLHTLPLNLTLLQVGGVWETDEIGSERARPLLKATQLSHNRMEQRGLLDSKLQAGPIKKWWERTLRNEVWFRRHSPRGCRVSHAQRHLLDLGRRTLGVNEKTTLPRLDWVSSQSSRGKQEYWESLKTDDQHLTALPFSRGEARQADRARRSRGLEDELGKWAGGIERLPQCQVLPMHA